MVARHRSACSAVVTRLVCKTVPLHRPRHASRVPGATARGHANADSVRTRTDVGAGSERLRSPAALSTEAPLVGSRVTQSHDRAVVPIRQNGQDWAMDWNFQLVEQIDRHWTRRLRPRLEGLADDEYLWEPVPSWSTRPRGTTVSPAPIGIGEFVRDDAPDDPEPAPFTTIAWRLAHMTVDVLAMRSAGQFGRNPASWENWEYAGSADEALNQLDHEYQTWLAGIRGLGDEGFDPAVWADGERLGRRAGCSADPAHPPRADSSRSRGGLPTRPVRAHSQAPPVTRLTCTVSAASRTTAHAPFNPPLQAGAAERQGRLHNDRRRSSLASESSLVTCAPTPGPSRCGEPTPSPPDGGRWPLPPVAG